MTTNVQNMKTPVHVYYRAWQRKLHSLVKNKDHQAELYACLWMLISEQDENTFLKNQDTFLSYWHNKEPEFVTYYQHEYMDRAGLLLFFGY